MNEFLFYLWMADVVDCLKTISWFLFGFSLAGIVTNVVVSYIDDEKYNLPKYVMTTFIVSAIVLVLLPSKQTMYVAAAGQATQQFSQTEAGKKLITAFEKKVDDYIAGEKK